MRTNSQVLLGPVWLWLLCSGSLQAQDATGAGKYKDCEITYATREFVTEMDQALVKAITSLDVGKVSAMAEFPLRIRDGHRTYFIRTPESFRTFFPTVFNNKWLQEFNNGSYFRCRGNEYQYGEGLIGILGDVDNKSKPFKIVVLSVPGAQAKAPPAPAPAPAPAAVPSSPSPSPSSPAAAETPSPEKPPMPAKTQSTSGAAFQCATENHVVHVDPIQDSTYRYRSFGIQTGAVGKPQLELKNGRREQVTSGACSSTNYTFVNVDTTYRLSQMPCDTSEKPKYRLAIIRNKKVIDEWECR